jgi:hypothetical protein
MTWTHRQRMLTTIRGGMPDRIPFAPRLDLWFAANKRRGTLPAAYRDCRHWDEVSRRQGWAIARVILNIRVMGTKPSSTAPWAFTGFLPKALLPICPRMLNVG